MCACVMPSTARQVRPLALTLTLTLGLARALAPALALRLCYHGYRQPRQRAYVHMGGARDA